MRLAIFLWKPRLISILLFAQAALCLWSAPAGAKAKPTRIPGSEVYVEWVSPTHVKLVDKAKLKKHEKGESALVADTVDEVAFEFTHPYENEFMPVGVQAVTSLANPRYPERAKLYYVEGDIQIRVLVSEEGVVREAMVSSESGADVGFERAALEAAMLCSYSSSPNGKSSWLSYPVAFRSSGTDPAKRFSVTTGEAFPLSPTAARRPAYRPAPVTPAEPHEGQSVVVDIPLEEYSPAPDEFVAVQAMPTIIKDEQPVYPMVALLDNREATVWVKALVDKEGKVREARIAKSSGMDVGFDEAALEAAYKKRYKPANQNGKAVAIWVTYPVEFKLK